MQLPPVEDRACHLNLHETIVDPDEYKEWKKTKNKEVK